MNNKYSQLNDKTPLWQYLGVNKGADKQTVNQAFARACHDKNLDQNQVRLAWKILQDPYFGSAYYNICSTKKIVDAGWFDNLANLEYNNTNRENPNWMVTPFNKIKNNLKNKSAKPKAVLLSTGAFSPIHLSHIEMMEIAKEELEQKGYQVVGGYLSPSHDIYVSRKNNGTAAFNANYRINLCQLATADNDWLMVDPWEALHTDIEETYSDVLTRLQNYLDFHFDEEIKVFYVFGSDNAAFARAFINHGQAVCVSRQGYENNLSEIKNEEFIKNNSRIIFTQDTSKEASSTAIRHGDYNHLQQSVKDKYLAWKNKLNTKEKEELKSYPYFIRNEGNWMTKNWNKNNREEKLDEQRNILKIALANNIKDSFINDNNIEENISVDIHYLDLNQQKKKIEPLIKKKKTLSLDNCIKGDFNLNLSGAFEIADGQFYRKALTARPGSDSIKNQIDSIPGGNYTLIEDDIATGNTLRMIKKLLPKNVIIEDMVILTEHTEVKTPDPLDIIDLRDFLVGSKESGLVVSLPNGENVRAPYLLPYVSVVSRAKLPISSEKDFSIKMWAANEEFFKNITPTIKLKEANPAFQKLMKYIGFDNEDTMENICKWHRERLENTQPTADYHIEFAHIYTDEDFSQEQIDSINTLKETITKLKSENKTYITSILIDNFNPTENTLKEEEYLNKIRSHGVPIDFVAYEAGFQTIADKIIQLLPKEKLKFEYFNKKQKQVLLLDNGEKKIGLQEKTATKEKHTCAILSAAWTLCRLNCFMFPINSLRSLTGKNINAKNIITIILDKYIKSEDKVMEIINSIKYKNHKGRINYVFHKSSNQLKHKI